MAETSILNHRQLKTKEECHRQLKTKKDVEGTGLGLQNGEKAIHVEMEKQMSGKQMFAGPGRVNGLHQSEL